MFWRRKPNPPEPASPAFEEQALLEDIARRIRRAIWIRRAFEVSAVASAGFIPVSAPLAILGIGIFLLCGELPAWGVLKLSPRHPMRVQLSPLNDIRSLIRLFELSEQVHFFSDIGKALRETQLRLMNQATLQDADALDFPLRSRLYAALEHSKFRQAAVYALGQLGDTHAIPLLEPIAKDENPELAKTAQDALQRLRPQDILERLRPSEPGQASPAPPFDLSALIREIQCISKAQRRLDLFVPTGLLFLWTLILVSLLAQLTFYSQIIALPCLLVTVSIGFFFSLAIGISERAIKRRVAVLSAQLDRIDDLRTLAPLLEITQFNSVLLLRPALLRLLSRSALSETTLTAKQKECLAKLVHPDVAGSFVCRDVTFTVTVLQALGQAGDAKALAAVQRLQEQMLPAEIREAAEQCEEMLRTRLTKAQVGETLLHIVEQTNEQELLRPAGNAESDPDELLRPIATRPPAS